MGKLGSLLDASERRVDLEHVREVLGALGSKSVQGNTETNGNMALLGAIWRYLALGGADGVKYSQSRASGGFDSTGGVLEILDGLVDFECFRQVLGAL